MEETNPCRRISIGGNGWAICGPATQHPRPLSLNLFLFFLFCAVPPTIAPFSFNKDLSEGVRAQVTCMVEKGDPPFTIAWSKDGEAIAGPSPAAGFGNTGITGPRHTQTPAGLRVTNIDAHSSTIVIERVSAAHSGNYTCMARNSVAEVLWTAELIVRGKVEPINQDNHQKKKKKITTLARIDEIALQCFFNATHLLCSVLLFLSLFFSLSFLHHWQRTILLLFCYYLAEYSLLYLAVHRLVHLDDETFDGLPPNEEKLSITVQRL